MRVAVLRCRSLPSFVTWEIPDVDALFSDDRRLIAALEQRGVHAESVAWSDPDVDWSLYDAAVLRSTWDYIDDRGRFLDVLDEIEQSCLLLNSAAAARWSSDKHYLFDLASWGIPIVETIPADDATAAIEAVSAAGWSDVVVKPSVGAGAVDVRRMPVADLPMALEELPPGPDRWFIQPLVDSVIREGEWSFIVIGGTISHSLLKRPAAGDFRAHGIYDGTIEAADATADDLAQIERIVRLLPHEPSYARVDVLRVDGRLCVLELELIEPILYLDLAPGSADRLAETLLARIRAAS